MSVEGRDPTPAELVDQPGFRAAMPDDLLHTPGGGYRYRADDMNATIELRLVIDGRKYLCRELVDPMLWEYQLSRDETAFDSYLKHALRKWLGGLVMDSQAMGYFMSRVWVVRPGDEHDLQRCAHSNDGEHQNMWPRCLDGFILTELPGASPVPGVGGTARRDAMLGYCPCRCHQKVSNLRGPRPYMVGVGTFDEDQLP